MNSVQAHGRGAGSILHRPYDLLLVVLLFICSRAPLLNLGFGLDADAWRIAGSAFDIRNHLVYHTSRFPGYPVPEFINALVINHGWLATNCLTMLLSLFSVLVFTRIVEMHELRHKLLTVATYAFLPILWINSTNTMDYMWSLCFIMLTWYALLNDKALIAGLMMGMAVGSRLQTLILALPFIYLCYDHKDGLNKIIQFVLSMFASSILLYSPLLITYGLSFIRHYPSPSGLLQSGYLAVKHFGLPALIVLSVTICLSGGSLRNAITRKNKQIIFLILSVVLALIFFIVLPYHTEYIIPFLPFILLLVYQIGKRPLLILTSILIISHAFVAIGSVKHLGNRKAQVRVFDVGTVITNYAARKQQLAIGRNFSTASINEHSVVIMGPWLPILAYLDENVSSVRTSKRMYDCNLPSAGVRDFQHDVSYRYLLTSDELEALLKEGFKVYYINGVREYTIEVYGFDLAFCNTTYVPLEGKGINP